MNHFNTEVIIHTKRELVIKRILRKMMDVCIVENGHRLCEFLKPKIEEKGFHVKTVHSAEEGLKFLEKYSTDLLILGYDLPDLNGRDFILQLKSGNNAVPPFIVLSDQNEVRLAVEMMKLGAKDYILKDSISIETIPVIIDHIKKENKLNQTEVALAELNSFSKQIVESANIGIIVYDLNLKYRVWNPYMEKITGFTTSQVIGKIPNEIFPFLKKLKVMEYKEKALLGETVNSVDYQYEIPENEKMGWATDSSTPLYNTEGKITGVITTFRDITERKAIEESLILRKNQLRQIIDLLPHYIYAKENNGNFILANKAVANFYGVSIKKMKGLTDIVFNQNAEIISCFTQGGKIIKEEIITHSDGSKRILETTNIPYKTIDDKTSAELCISIDVTKRKQDQELIIKLSKAVEQSANSIIITDIKGNIEYINPKFNTVSGYNNDEVIGRHITILDTGKQPNEYNREIPRTVRSGQIWKGEVLLKNKNGSCLWSQLTVSPIENKTGDIKNCLIIAEDITALKENELRLKTIINNIPDVVVFKDENKRWIEVNRAAIQLFNLEKVDCTGKTAKEFAPNSEFFDEIIRSTDLSDEIAFNSKNPYTFDKVIPVPNGNPKTYEFKKVPIFNNDHSRKGLVVIGRDITERMNKEKELMQAKKKAEQHDRLKTSFLQNISHEIRTPMNAIVGFSKMLGQSEFSLEKKKNFASIIINNSNQLLSIVTNILAISSIETQQEVIYERNVNINNELLSLFTTYKDRADEMGINFKFQKQLIDRQSEVYTDKLKLNQILTNLLNNAFKFTIKGEIEFGYLLRPSLVEETKYDLVFFVKDTGIGIEAQYLDKIFDCFVQLDLLENRKYGGNGIGLSVSKGFVELLGGKIWVESEREKGSIFYFSLPYKPVNSDSMSNLSKEQIGGNMKILIA